MHNRAALLAMPEDPWDAVIAKAHEQGKPFWACMRFNDAHPPEYGLRSRFGPLHVSTASAVLNRTKRAVLTPITHGALRPPKGPLATVPNSSVVIHGPSNTVERP